MRYFTEQEVQQLLPMQEAIGVVRAAFLAYGRDEAQNQPRRRLLVPGGAVLHMLAGSWKSYFGTKVYSTHPKHGAHFTLLLYKAETAEPLAQFEANYLGQIRTGAASAVATDWMAVTTAQRLTVLGSGFQAQSQAEAMLAVRNIRHLRVWSRNEERRQRFADEFASRHSITTEACSSAAEALAEADIVVTATTAKEPLFQYSDLPQHCHVNAMGSNQAERREVPSELVHKAASIAVDSFQQASQEAGDLLLAAPVDQWGQLPLQELGALLQGPPQPYQGQTLFKSVGIGLEDIAAASLIYEKALLNH